jgi:hypothetical protein
MKSGKGPYMQQAGRGNMEKTGRGVPMQFKGPMYPDPTDPPTGTDSDPAKNYPRGVNDYQPRYDAGKEYTPAPLIPPSPYVNPDTGETSSRSFNSATVPGSSGFGTGLPVQRITAESQQRAISGQSGGNLRQNYFTQGKDIFDRQGNMVTDFSSILQGRGADNIARSQGMKLDNINQQQVNQNIREGINTQNRSNKFKDAVKLKDMAYDVVKRDSTVTSNANKVFNANADYQKNAPPLPGVNMYKKKNK